MALPPTPLTELLYSAPTPDAMYDALEAHRTLSSHALANRREVVAMMADVIEASNARYNAHPGMTGPTAVDQVARALVSSSYLNARGKELVSPNRRRDTLTVKSWWQFWK